MAYSNKDEVYWKDVGLAADKNGDAYETRNQACGSVQLVWAGASATDAVVKLQESNDGMTWFDITSMTQTISAPAGSKLFKLTRDILLCSYIRAVLTKNSETTGTVTLKIFLKGNK